MPEIINLTINQASKGEQGPQGLQGPQGEQGPKGEDSEVSTSDIINIKGEGWNGETIKGNADEISSLGGDIDDLAGEDRTTETVKGNAEAIAQVNTQINDIANKVNSAPKLVAVDEYPLDPEEGTIYYKIILPDDPTGPEEPEDPIVKYYTEGVENVEWVEAYSTGDETYGTQSKESDHLYIEIFEKTGAATNRTYATKDPVDVTSLKEIEIDMSTSETVACSIRFGVAQDRDTSNSSASYAVTTGPSAKPNGYTSIMDVSELTGEYYIRVCLMNANSAESRPGQLRVYNVRGVKNA